jgi:glyoxylase-like metal-dependent hydrolase (beta-lactamase superfamily II)
MRRSLIRFLTLPDAMRVLPGHGAETTVGTERATNPFLREAG